MAKVELIDIDSSSDDEPNTNVAGFKPESIDETLNSFKNENPQGSSPPKEPDNLTPKDTNNSVHDSNKDATSSVNQPPSQDEVDKGKDEDEEEKKRKYIDKLLNMHSHVCNRLASLDCYMDSLQRLKWQRQTTMSVPAINGKFPTNQISNVQPPANNAMRQQSFGDQDAGWSNDSRPPWLISNGSSTRYRNSAPPRARKKTYKKKKTTRKPTKQTARKSTTTWMPAPRKSQPAKTKKQTAKSTTTASTSKASTSAKKPTPKTTSKPKQNPVPKKTVAAVKKETVKKEHVKKERVKGEPS